jgi:hypothetical protein
MKKILLSAIAVGALAAAGAASADIQGSYRDEYGDLWIVDQGGHHTKIPKGSTVGIVGIRQDGIAQYGPVPDYRNYRNFGNYGTYGNYARAYQDSDRDGVPDSRDRRPFNPRRH